MTSFKMTAKILQKHSILGIDKSTWCLGYVFMIIPLSPAVY